jgi:hypothetical protein
MKAWVGQRFFRTTLQLLMSLILGLHGQGQTIRLSTGYAVISIDDKGFITSLRAKGTGKEYCPAGLSSPLISLEAGGRVTLPEKAVYNAARHEIVLTFNREALATVSVEARGSYLRLQLKTLSGITGVDNIIWGPYKTSISRTIGDIIGVVRDGKFAIGMLGLNDNTTAGAPTDGDMSFMYYYIHSPDPVRYPLPPSLKEGQTFAIGGDGSNDVAFFSHPEEYYQMNVGEGARLEPLYGSSICMHSRDRRKQQMIRFPYYPAGLDGGLNSPRHQLVLPVEADLIGSAVALYACPDSLGLKTIESVVVHEGLPHPTIDGKWIKDPAAFRPDIAWYGVHDSLISYAHQLKLTSVQDEGWGEYYPDRADRWGRNTVEFTGKTPMTIPAYGQLMQKEGIRWGLHTLCEFLQPGRNSDVAPVPSDSLGIMMRTTLSQALSVDDTVIAVVDTLYFNEFGGWEGNHTNVLKIGKELIAYDGITTTRPYVFLHVKRGAYKTMKGSYPAGATVDKLQPNCYRGFAPDMGLQEVYGDYYGRFLAEGGMDYIDFDGLESCMYQGHGEYSFKRFFRSLFDSYYKHGGKYLRIMGSSVYEGNWHYMSVCNIGGDNHMFDPVTNKWGIEGKDMRNVFQGSYLPVTFGIVAYSSDWSLYDVENLQAKSIGWDATYMLGLSQQEIESSPEKAAFFRAYRTWENVRAAQLFQGRWKRRLADLRYKYHLEQLGPRSFVLYPVRECRWTDLPLSKDAPALSVKNELGRQPLDLAIRIHCPGEGQVNGLTIKFANEKPWTIDHQLKDGDFIIYKHKKLYVADRHRRKIADLMSPGLIMLPPGSSTLRVSLSDLTGPNKEKIMLQVVVTVVGKGEPVDH